MPFLPIPRENSNSLARLDNTEDILAQIKRTSLDIHSIYLYLERLREDSFNTITETLINDPTSILNAVLNVFSDSATIDFIVGASTITAEVKDSAITLAKLSASLQALITGLETSVSRVVALATTRTVPTETSLVVSRYFKILGTLVIQGDATLQVL